MREAVKIYRELAEKIPKTICLRSLGKSLVTPTTLFWGMARKADIHSMTACDAAKECSESVRSCSCYYSAWLGAAKKIAERESLPDKRGTMLRYLLALLARPGESAWPDRTNGGSTANLSDGASQGSFSPGPTAPP